jgi:hypothetical protein
LTSNRAAADAMLTWNLMGSIIPLVSDDKVVEFRVKRRRDPTNWAMDWDKELSMVWSTSALESAAVVDPRLKNLQPDIVRAKVKEILDKMEADSEERNDANPLAICRMVMTTLDPLTQPSLRQDGLRLNEVEDAEENRGSRICKDPACLIM